MAKAEYLNENQKCRGDWKMKRLEKFFNFLFHNLK